MPVIYQVGDKANLLERLAASQIVMTDENTNYPKGGLGDRVPALEARFNTAGADRAVTVDLDQLQTLGNFEDAALAGWTDADTGTGASTSSTANPHSPSTRHLRLNAGVAGVAERYRDIVVRPGERLRVFSFWIDSDGTNFAELRIRNMTTGKYATSAGAWQTSATFAVRGNSAAYADAAGGYEVVFEDFLTCQRETMTIRVSVRATANANIDVDDLALGVIPNLLTIHGHNVPMEITTEWRHSDDNSTFLTYQTAAPYLPSYPFSSVVAGTFSQKRYTQWRVPGTPTDGVPRLIGELGLWQAKAAARSANFDPSLELVPPQVRNEVGSHFRVHRKNVSSLLSPRVYRFSKRVVSASEYQTVRDDLARAHGGAHPVIWIPDTAAPAPIPVIYGIVPPTTRWTQPFPTAIGVWDLEEFEIHEQPFPNLAL